MKDKQEIVSNWLPRYTGVALEDFGQHILLTNFGGYLDTFARLTGAELVGRDKPMPSATVDGITMINFGMGSANAATVMDLLGAIMPKAVLFLGKCGGLKKKNQLGDLILPIAAIGNTRSPSSFLRLRPPHLPRNNTAFGGSALSRSITVAAFALPMPKLIMVMPSMVALGMGRSRPTTGAPVRRAKVCR